MADSSEYLRRPEHERRLKVLEVLRRWDPIGVISDTNADEYDGYSHRIVHLLDAGATADELVEHLRRIVVQGMEIRFDEAHTRDCARELVEYWMQR